MIERKEENMKEAYDNLLTRRSCRAYRSEQISDRELEMILEAGKYAPTAMGRQSPLIVAVKTPETVDKIEKLNSAVLGNPDGHPFYGAPAVVVVFAAPSPTGASDANLVIGNMLNAANAIGVDSCYIWRAKEAFDSEEGRILKSEWGIPDDYSGAGNVILGYGKPEGKREPIPRKEGYAIIV